MNYFNYYTEIEDTFIRRRGKHLLLSPMDWALIESWKLMGVPLHVALRGIEQAFDSHAAARAPRRRSVKSLLYCQEEVEAQFAEWLETQRGAAGVVASATEDDANAAEEMNGHGGLPFPRAAILAHLAEAHATLERLNNSSAATQRQGEGELREALRRASERLAELEKDFREAARPNAEHLENSLTALEGLLDRAVREALRPEELAAKRQQAGEQLRPYRTRMERATYEQTLDNLLAKLLREERGLPRLSLFYL